MGCTKVCLFQGWSIFWAIEWGIVLLLRLLRWFCPTEVVDGEVENGC